jgi:cysteine desulfuration protein SufE
MATEAFEEIAETFEFLDDWEDRYRHVIELGKAMPPLDESFKVPALKVQGCASQVWLRPVIEDGRFDFQGESDAMIVRGLIAVLHALYSGLPVAEVAKVDARPNSRGWASTTISAPSGRTDCAPWSSGFAKPLAARDRHAVGVKGQVPGNRCHVRLRVLVRPDSIREPREVTRNRIIARLSLPGAAGLVLVRTSRSMSISSRGT